MRAPGEVRLALLKAATELTTVARSPTMREIATHAKVGQAAALQTVRRMKQAGVLCIVRTRKVGYRNRPVAEYAPAEKPQDAPCAAALEDALSNWLR